MIKKYSALSLLIFAFFFSTQLAYSETIDVLIKGIDDGVKSNKQQDYKEALLNAKIQAIEHAGVEITSITKMVNFKLKFDLVESKANAVLMPGFKVMDMGYQTDGSYQIVLVGKVKTKTESIENKQLRYAANLIKKGKKNKAHEIVNKIIDTSTDDKSVAETLFCKVAWGFTYDVEDDKEILEKLRSFYPDSKYVALLESYLNIKSNNNKKHNIYYKVSKVFNKKDRVSIHNKPIDLYQLIGRKRSPESNEVRINLLGKNNEEFKLKIRAAATGYSYSTYESGQPKTKRIEKDYNYIIKYSFYMNDKLIGTETNKTDSAFWTKRSSWKFNGAYTRGPNNININTELIEYPVKIGLKGNEDDYLEITINTLPDALPQPRIK